MRDVRIAGEPDAGRSGAPIQAEALAYFARMTTPPSAAFREAMNWAIWRWKAVGAWAHIKALWFLAADTSQAGLLCVNDASPLDAQIVGVSPTFTPLKGFSGFTSGKQIRFPITSAALGSDYVYAFVALKAAVQQNAGVPQYTAMIQCDLGAENARPGNFRYQFEGPSEANQGIVMPCSSRLVAKSTLVGGARAGVWILPGVVDSWASSLTARGSNYITTGHDYTSLNRLCAYGFLADAASNTVCRQFVAILATLVDMLGALD